MLLVILLTLIGKFLLERRNFSPSEMSTVFLPPPGRYVYNLIITYFVYFPTLDKIIYLCLILEVRDERKTRVTFKIGDDFPEDATTQTEDVIEESPKETLCIQCTRRRESIRKFSSSCLLGVNSHHKLPVRSSLVNEFCCQTEEWLKKNKLYYCKIIILLHH